MTASTTSVVIARPVAPLAKFFNVAVLIAFIAAVLYAVMAVYSSGQVALAMMLLGVSVLALWIYTSSRSGAWRYLFPGIAAALLFVVLPMLFTLGIGFTNQSSSNLIDFERARKNLIEESVIAPDSQRPFTLHAESSQFRLMLQSQAGETWVTPPFALASGVASPQKIALAAGAALTSVPVSTRDLVQWIPSLRSLTLLAADGRTFSLAGLHEFAELQSLYAAHADGSLTDRVTRKNYRVDMNEGFYTSSDGDRLQPGFRVNVGWRNFAKVFTDEKFRGPSLSVFIWTVIFAALSVLGAAALGLLLAAIFSWDRLRFRTVYRVVLFLPYAVPGFLSILIFKGLFNQNLGEVNLILNALFGIKPAWFSDPLLARSMLVLVNIWLGFPYMMILCSGLLQSIPTDLREASAEAGAGPFTHFWRITLPLITKPLTPLLIAAFAFNFNNFVLISLLTGGRPDVTDTILPAGTTDILVSYTWGIAFNDSGQQYGLAAAISTVIFLLVAAMTLIQLRYTRVAQAGEVK
jgi:maltose/maltodextrin transport system permease protein